MRHVLVAGAGSPLGITVVRLALARGDRVLAAVPHPARLPLLGELEAEYPERLTVLPFDATDAAGILPLADAVQAVGLPLDLLVHAGWTDSAGPTLADQQRNRTLTDVHEAALLALVRHNALSALMLTRELLPLLRKGDRAVVLFVTSFLASLERRREGGHYGVAAAGGALHGVARALAFDLEPDRIVVLVGSPGSYKTALHGPAFQLSAETAATGLLAVADRATLAETGLCFDWRGDPVPW